MLGEVPVPLRAVVADGRADAEGASRAGAGAGAGGQAAALRFGSVLDQAAERVADAGEGGPGAEVQGLNRICRSHIPITYSSHSRRRG